MVPKDFRRVLRNDRGDRVWGQICISGDILRVSRQAETNDDVLESGDRSYDSVFCGFAFSALCSMLAARL